MKIRRTKVTVVTEHVFTFAEHRSPIQVECETCGAPTRILRPDDALLESGSVEAIRREVEASGLHLTVGANGVLFVCFTQC